MGSQYIFSCDGFFEFWEGFFLTAKFLKIPNFFSFIGKGFFRGGKKFFFVSPHPRAFLGGEALGCHVGLWVLFGAFVF